MLYRKMARKMFGDGNEEEVYRLSSWFDSIKDTGEESINLELMRQDYKHMWCKEYDCFPDTGECGYNCNKYRPCNRKNGRCRNLVPGYVGTGKWYRLFIDRKLEEIE